MFELYPEQRAEGEILLDGDNILTNSQDIALLRAKSVNEKVMIKRIDQQIRVNKLMADAFHNCQFDSKHLKKYMLSYLDIITTVSSIMLVRAGTQEALDKKKEMLEYIREQDLWLYHKLRYSILGRAANLPGRGGRKMFVAAYKVCQKFYGFN